MKTPVIYVDAGHSLHDPGAVFRGHKEHDLVVDITKLVAAFLKQDFTIFMTPPEADLSDRIARINTIKPDLVISLHANASADPEAKSTWLIYDDVVRTASRKAKRVAEYIQRAYKEKRPGRSVLMLTDNSPYINNSINLGILSKTTVPAVLVELGFITNEEDLRDLVNAGSAHAWAVATGVRRYFSKVNRSQIAKSPSPSSLADFVKEHRPVLTEFLKLVLGESVH